MFGNLRNKSPAKLSSPVAPLLILDMEWDSSQKEGRESTINSGDKVSKLKGQVLDLSSLMMSEKGDGTLSTCLEKCSLNKSFSCGMLQATRPLQSATFVILLLHVFHGIWEVEK